MLKGTRLIMNKEAKIYSETIEKIRGCLHRGWI